jgi:hypothetical protein
VVEKKDLLQHSGQARERNHLLLISLGFQLGDALRNDTMPLSKDWTDPLLNKFPEFAAAYLAGLLDDEQRACLQIMLACHNSLPLADCKGELTRLGLLNERLLLTDFGRDVAAVLLELA